MTLTRSDFVGVTLNALSGLGFAPDAAMVVFPMEMFLPDSELGALQARKDEFDAGLTRWQSVFKPARAGACPTLTIEAPSHEAALVQFNNLCITNLWGDGLPLWPATIDRVEWILRGATLPRFHRLGSFQPRGGITTVEVCAIALAMAGGRPEYLPVLIAIVEAALAPEANMGAMQATSGGPFTTVIVNGPIARDIRLNSGFGCFGPDPQQPAGASIGRALHLLQQNAGGALPGIGSMGVWGPMRYTNLVFAEDEAGLPVGWLPHATQRHGYAPGTNSVSLVYTNSVVNICRRSAQKETRKEDVEQGLYRMADTMALPNYTALQAYDEGTPGIMVVPAVVAGMMAAEGWTQNAIRQFLWEHSHVPLEQVRRGGGLSWLEIDSSPVVRASQHKDPWPIARNAESIVFVVAGGAHPTHAHWLQSIGPRVIGSKIQLPPDFDRLLADADRDLGCAADACRI